MSVKRKSQKIARHLIGIAASLLIGFTFLSSSLVYAQTVSYQQSLSTGWTLAGNSLSTPINVKATFGSQTSIQTVWKWDTANSRWAFYAPSLDTAGTLTSYTTSKGYGLLATINPGEGFWVNASTPVSLGTRNGTGLSLAASNLAPNWNLVATGDNIAPATFSTNVGNVTTLWAWDNVNSAWYFYAPALAANSTLASYIQSKSYKDFGAQTLGNGLGFWVNYAGASLALFAGNMGGAGSADGVGANASFNGPYSVSTDSAGNVYVADTSNNIIRKVSPTGVVSTFAGTTGVAGSREGYGQTAIFNNPTGIATDSAGNVYVADTFNHTIRKITPIGLVGTLAGTAGVIGSADGTGAAASFYYPYGIATDSASNVYVVDKYNHTIRKITPTGVVTTLAGSAGIIGSADGTGAAARFNYPTGIAVDSAGNAYVADSTNRTIRKITSGGVVSTLAGTVGATGSADGTGAAASFYNPRGVATDSAGNVYVADTFNHTIRKITPAGVVSTPAGTAGVIGSTDGIGAVASFNYPYGAATDSAGNVYAADTFNNSIRKITPDGVVSTLAGLAGGTGSADGTGMAASFYNPTGIATDSSGNAYVADTSNNTIRKITPAGVVTTLAGTGLTGSADGTGAAARFYAPQGVATDSAGNVYVADYSNFTIRKISSTGVVSTLAGTAGAYGSSDGTGAAARFYGPSGVATDSAGNVYVADYFNSTIRKITPSGVVSTLAGTAGSCNYSDGTGAAARFCNPTGIATDSAGNIYVTDTSYNIIRKITPNGVVTTLAGYAGARGSADGTGSAATFNNPTGIATDSADNVYVADSGNNTIRKITPAGVVSTVVGVVWQLGFSAGVLPGELWHPSGLAFSGRTLYITTKNGVAVVTNVP